MEIALDSRARKLSFLGATCLLAGSFLTASSMQFLGDCFSRSAEHLSLAIRLAPNNAEYREHLGRQLLQQRGDVPAALQQYQAAVALNPYNASHWVAIATARQILNDVPGQRYALEHAIAANPTTPDLAWSAGNFFLAQGDKAAALREFKTVLENEAEMAYPVFVLSSHVAEVPEIVKKILPANPNAYLSFIDFLTAQKNTAGAAQVWSALSQLGKPFEASRALAYVDYLLSQREVVAARSVWRQAAQLCGLSAYLPSRENLVVNSNFDSDILNGGFDWRYTRQANVAVSLDPAEFHSGRRSLSIIFDGPGVDDAGIAQYVPVEPDATYEFHAYYKADGMDGAGGPRFDVQDAYSGTHYFSSDDLRTAATWRQINGEFKTAADAHLVVIRVLRVPAGSPIRGKLWVDDFQLTEKEMEF